MFKDRNMAENWKNLLETLKKIEFCRICRICFLQNCSGLKSNIEHSPLDSSQAVGTVLIGQIRHWAYSSGLKSGNVQMFLGSSQRVQGSRWVMRTVIVYQVRQSAKSSGHKARNGHGCQCSSQAVSTVLRAQGAY